MAAMNSVKQKMVIRITRPSSMGMQFFKNSVMICSTSDMIVIRTKEKSSGNCSLMLPLQPFEMRNTSSSPHTRRKIIRSAFGRSPPTTHNQVEEETYSEGVDAYAHIEEHHRIVAVVVEQLLQEEAGRQLGFEVASGPWARIAGAPVDNMSDLPVFALVAHINQMNVVKLESMDDCRRYISKLQNDNLVLQQKCSLLEIKLKEAEERNSNIQKMNGTIMNVLNDLNSNQQQSKQAGELLKAQDAFNSKLLYLNDRIKQLEGANRNLQAQLQESVIANNQMNQRAGQLSEANSNLLKQLGALESQIKSCHQRSTGLNSEKQQLERQLEDKDFENQKYKFEMEVRVEELMEENTKLKDELKQLMNQILRRTQCQFSSAKNSPERPESEMQQTKSPPIKQQQAQQPARPQTAIQKVTPKKLWK